MRFGWALFGWAESNELKNFQFEDDLSNLGDCIALLKGKILFRQTGTANDLRRLEAEQDKRAKLTSVGAAGKIKLPKPNESAADRSRRVKNMRQAYNKIANKAAAADPKTPPALPSKHHTSSSHQRSSSRSTQHHHRGSLPTHHYGGSFHWHPDVYGPPEATAAQVHPPYHFHLHYHMYPPHTEYSTQRRTPAPSVEATADTDGNVLASPGAAVTPAVGYNNSNIPSESSRSTDDSSGNKRKRQGPTADDVPLVIDGVDAGRSEDPAAKVSTFSVLFSCWFGARQIDCRIVGLTHLI